VKLSEFLRILFKEEEQQQLAVAPGVVLLWVEEVGTEEKTPRPTSTALVNFFESRRRTIAGSTAPPSTNFKRRRNQWGAHIFFIFLNNA